MTTKENRAAKDARIEQLLINLNGRFDMLDGRLDTIENQIVTFVGEMAAARACRDDNKKKLHRSPISFSAFCQLWKISGNDSI